MSCPSDRAFVVIYAFTASLYNKTSTTTDRIVKMLTVVYKNDKIYWQKITDMLCKMSLYSFIWTSHGTTPCWRHPMETFSSVLVLCAGNSPVTGEFPAQRPVTWSFDVFFLIWTLNKRLSKQSWSWWFETPTCSLWRHWNVVWGYWAINTLQRKCHFDEISITGCTGLPVQPVMKIRQMTFHTHLPSDDCDNIFNKLKPRQNGRDFADDIFKCIFLNEN